MKESNVVIAHGAYGYPQENWFGWINKDLTALGVECYVPQLPTPSGHNLDNWMAVFDHSIGHLINENSILIGHSLGAAFLLR